MTKHCVTIATWMSLSLAGCAMADAPTSQPATTQATTQATAGNPTQPVDEPPFNGELTAKSPAAHVLSALEARGAGLKDFRADVTLWTTDSATLTTDKRTGVVWYQKQAPGDERIRVDFKTRKKNDGRAVVEQLEYMLDDGWLTERDHAVMKQIRRQVLKPGEKTDLLKLGEGPFPLPLGQRADDVLKLFDVKKLDPLQDIDTDNPPPADTVRIRLTPKAGSQFADDFQTIDVWVDLKTQMPARIETLDIHGATIRTTDLANVKINTSMGDDMFKLEKLDYSKWKDESETF